MTLRTTPTRPGTSVGRWANSAAYGPGSLKRTATGTDRPCASMYRHPMRIDVRGLTFQVHTGGPEDGPAVLLLHGFPQDSREWDGITGGLHDAGLRTVALDQRGYSPAPGRRAGRRTGWPNASPTPSRSSTRCGCLRRTSSATTGARGRVAPRGPPPGPGPHADRGVRAASGGLAASVRRIRAAGAVGVHAVLPHAVAAGAGAVRPRRRAVRRVAHGEAMLEPGRLTGRAQLVPRDLRPRPRRARPGRGADHVRLERP